MNKAKSYISTIENDMRKNSLQQAYICICDDSMEMFFLVKTLNPDQSLFWNKILDNLNDGGIEAVSVGDYTLWNRVQKRGG